MIRQANNGLWIVETMQPNRVVSIEVFKSHEKAEEHYLSKRPYQRFVKALKEVLTTMAVSCPRETKF